MSTISPEARQKFAAVNARLGLGPETSTHPSLQELPADHEGPVIFSGDPLLATVRPHMVPVASIDEFRKMTHVPTDTDEHIRYPPPPSAALLNHFERAGSRTALVNGLSAKDERVIKQAAAAFVMGNPQKVERYKDLINNLYFPLQMAVYASTEPLLIDKEIIIKGPTPVNWNYPSIIMMNGGSIVQEENAPLTVNTSSVEAETDDGDFVIHSTPADRVPAQADSGSDGSQGEPGLYNPNTDGTSTYNASTCTYDCSKSPGKGATGGRGGDAVNAKDGIKGADMSPSQWNVKSIVGTLVIVARGGKGQDGGNGGNGGPGGPGAPGGHPDPNRACGSSNGPTGDTGPGGNGTDGGKGGDGGDGATITIYYNILGQGINMDGVETSQPGAGGAGSHGGIGGTNGTNGDPGINGNPGAKPIINPVSRPD
jgi:hypothetical protein